MAEELTSRQETDSSAHLDKRSKQHHVSANPRFDLHSPKNASLLFSKDNTATRFCRLCKEVCLLYAGADWLSSAVNQRVARHTPRQPQDVQSPCERFLQCGVGGGFLACEDFCLRFDESFPL